MEKQFKVFGDEELLKNSKINVVEISDKSYRIQTLLYMGKKKSIKTETEVAFIYEIYVSYKDSLVNVLKFENIMVYANDHINHIYLNKVNNKISISYVGREHEMKKNQGFGEILIPKEEFFKKNNIKKKNDIEKYSHLFFDNH